MISVSQILAARAMLRWSQKDLAQRSGLSKAALVKLEAGHVSNPRPMTLDRLKNSLESAGIEFIDGGGVRPASDKLVIYEGQDAFLKTLDDVFYTLRKAPHSSKEVLISCVDQNLWTSATTASKKRLQDNGISLRFLIKEGVSLPHFPADSYRQIPKSSYTNAPQFVYGPKYAVLSFSPTGTARALIIHDASLAQVQRNHFETIWQQTAA